MVSFPIVSIDFRYAGHKDSFFFFPFFFFFFFWEHGHRRITGFAVFHFCPWYSSALPPPPIPAAFREKRTNRPQEVCHFLADSASEEQAVRPTEVLTPRKASRQLFAELPHYRRASYCFFSFLAACSHRSPPSQPAAKSCSGTCLCSVKLSYRIVLPKWSAAGIGEQAPSDHTVI